MWTVAGSEFGSEKRTMIIAKALYGLKSSGTAWRAKLAETMKSMGYESTQADPERTVKPNG